MEKKFDQNNPNWCLEDQDWWKKYSEMVNNPDPQPQTGTDAVVDIPHYMSSGSGSGLKIIPGNWASSGSGSGSGLRIIPGYWSGSWASSGSGSGSGLRIIPGYWSGSWASSGSGSGSGLRIIPGYWNGKWPTSYVSSGSGSGAGILGYGLGLL